MEPTTPVNQTNNSNKFWLWLILIVIPVGILAYIVMNRSSNVSQPAPITSNSLINEVEPASDSNSLMITGNNEVTEPIVVGSYKDGAYSATGEYISPGGPEEVKLTLTLKDGTITDSVFTAQSERPISQKFQKEFSAGYKEYVIGKKIDEVQITKVSGSSLTPKGFNDALAKIKAEAKL